MAGNNLMGRALGDRAAPDGAPAFIVADARHDPPSRRREQ
ncbi:hypothetical protein AZ16_0715 [Bordetella bronchiseptica B18-5 (C3)]|nr:hypothetical protein AZ16_0715 [Bordetella bronchiseptica B18-5 (C3)]KDD89340.1 hypothetical protein L524_0545 [Bordetella bronchiseptica MBORD762]